jgi:MFS family permease
MRSGVLPVLGGLVMSELAIVAALTWAGPTLTREFSLDAGAAGRAVALGLLVSGTAGPVLGGFVSDLAQRTGGARRSLLYLTLMSALAGVFGLFALGTDVGLARVLMSAFMLTVSAVLVAGIAVFTVVIPQESRGFCIAILAAAQLIFGVAVAPLSVSVLAGSLGGANALGNALACVCVGSCLLGSGAFWTGRQSGSRSMA